jgi:hypothetical protein
MGKMKFTDFPPCKNRFGCVQCRNDAKFVEHMKERFGDWECPEKIAFGTSIENMPPHIQAKISTYEKRLNQKGREVQKIEKEDKIFPDKKKRKFPEKTKRSFTETPGCMHRLMCVECRNNEKFRERIEKQLGPWECPEKIPLNTPLEEMPEAIKEVAEKREVMANAQKQKAEKIKIALDALEEVIPEKALGILDEVRAHIFPHTKKPSLCKNYTGEKVQVEKKCCGGKVKKVDGFVCSEFGEVEERKCQACQKFESKR